MGRKNKKKYQQHDAQAKQPEEVVEPTGEEAPIEAVSGPEPVPAPETLLGLA